MYNDMKIFNRFTLSTAIPLSQSPHSSECCIAFIGRVLQGDISGQMFVQRKMSCDIFANLLSCSFFLWLSLGNSSEGSVSNNIHWKMSSATFICDIHNTANRWWNIFYSEIKFSIAIFNLNLILESLSNSKNTFLYLNIQLHILIFSIIILIISQAVLEQDHNIQFN